MNNKTPMNYRIVYFKKYTELTESTYRVILVLKGLSKRILRGPTQYKQNHNVGYFPVQKNIKLPPKARLPTGHFTVS